MKLHVLNDMPSHSPRWDWGSLLLLFIDVCFSTVFSSSLESWVDIADATRKEERGTAK